MKSDKKGFLAKCISCAYYILFHREARGIGTLNCFTPVYCGNNFENGAISEF